MTTRLNNILERLPSLYRPDGDVTGLLLTFLRAAAESLEEVNRDTIDVLQSHWFRYADRAMLSAFVTLGRDRQSLAPSRIGDLIDFVEPAGVAARLRDASDPLSQYLRDRLSPATVESLLGYQDSQPPGETLQRRIIEALNQVVRDGPLYDAARFDGVALSQDTQQLLSRNPQGNDLVRLNVRLLEDAYPGGLTRMVQDSEYIRDLGRLAALVSVTPGYEPRALRDTVESYRTRVRRIVSLYRNGLGTTAALRGMVEAQLPQALNEIQERRDRGFHLEEFAPLVKTLMPVETRGEPEGIVGPMMRWSLTNAGLEPAAPTIYIQGVAPQTGLIDPTLRPLIELYRHGAGYPRLGIGYDHGDPIPEDQTLRLRPAYLSWIGGDTGIQQAEALPSDSWPADPTAPGPWQPPPGAPTDPVAAIQYTHDRALWVATNVNPGGQPESVLWRYDGLTWTAALASLPRVHCLLEDGQYLLLGTADGLRRVFLYPEGAAFSAEPVAAPLVGHSVYTIFRDNWNNLWVGADDGAARLAPDADPPTDYAPVASALQGTEVRDIAQDETGAMFFCAPQGLFQCEPLSDRWHWYAGEEYSDQVNDWEPFVPGVLPDDAQVFLPAATCVHPGPDGSLWIGTAAGIGRYVARSARGLTYRTGLEAFPDLVTGPVFDIREDARGLVWFCTERGLFRYDGRDWWQYQTDRWAQLGRADRLYQDTPEPEPRGAWRYHRQMAQWQRWDDGMLDWRNSDYTLRSAPEPAATTIMWTDHVSADLGAWDGETATFASAGGVDSNRLVARYKPDEERIIPGGIPAIPRLPVGESIWRYLSLEPADLVAAPEAQPYWTIEGRRIPPPPFPDAPGPARFDVETPPPPSNYDESVFAFNPAARCWFSWEPRQVLSVLARLNQRVAGERIDEAVLDRVWQGIQQVRPAGVRCMLAVGQEIVRGNDYG